MNSPESADGRSSVGAMRRWMRSLDRLWQMLRYYRSSQLALRLCNLMRRKWRRLAGLSTDRYRASSPLRLRQDPALSQLAHRRLEARGTATAELRRDIYTFLNVARQLPDPVDWRLDSCPEASHLWRFHLHYQEYLLDLPAAEPEGGGADRAWSLVLQWVRANALSDPRTWDDAWHPYCIARRLPVWIALWTLAPPNEHQQGDVLASLFAQASYLERHLERDLGGNHLLENARTLLLCGAFLEGPAAQRWLNTGSRILRSELNTQILPHGEHFERSPMYHAQMLDAVREVGQVVRQLDPQLAALCDHVSARMAAFLESIVHPDGGIPLLGDSALTRPALAGAAGPSAPGRAEVIGDYWVFRDGGDFLVFDAGPVGADALPAHAHADLLGFEASLGGQRVFVDSGVFDYADSPMRRYCRSTAAHNVLLVDGHDQCDVWSRFRMGYRGWPRGFAAGEQDGFCWARAEHNAYRRWGVPAVGRWLACRAGGPWFCADWASGRGRHQLTDLLHLHPAVRAELTGERQVRLTVADAVFELRFLVPGRIELTDGWYCPEFGVRQRASVICWESDCELPACSAWSLLPAGVCGEASLDITDNRYPRIIWRQDGTQTILGGRWGGQMTNDEIPNDEQMPVNR